MIKLKKILCIFLLSSLLFISTAFGPASTCCNTPCCRTALTDIELAVIDGVTPVIATTLQCSNQAAIQYTLMRLIGKAGFPDPTPSTQPPFGSSDVKARLNLSQSVCSTFAEIMVGSITSEIPKAWSCTASIMTGLFDLLTNACTSL
jgi:hypothetical protein